MFCRFRFIKSSTIYKKLNKVKKIYTGAYYIICMKITGLSDKQIIIITILLQFRELNI